MTQREKVVYLGQQPLQPRQQEPAGSFVELAGETYYRIAHSDQMPPFFMSLVSSADHWLFLASNGGVTAGRRQADWALFPYETEDKIIAHTEETGGKTVIRASRNGRVQLWEPFSERYAGVYRIERHLYKHIAGSQLIFEEINRDLQLTLRVTWRTGERFGFIKSGWLRNDGPDPCAIDLLDGLQNLLPYGATAALQSTMSSLLHAYKRNELEPRTGVGIFALSATLSDRAEPSESLQATVAWQVGLENPVHLLSTAQLERFRRGLSLTPESDLCGRPGAYLAASTFDLPPGESKEWHIVADVNQDRAAIVRLTGLLGQERAAIVRALEADIEQNTANQVGIVAAADGLQLSAARTTAAHHFANVLFNIMRGGIFADGYTVSCDDLQAFLQTRNRPVARAHAGWLAGLPEELPIDQLYDRAAAGGDADLIRLCYEYLPLIFSRRHGDPSRPWNHFSINLKKPDGSPHIDYQGNWRDIFQNWEPLLLSFPGYIEGVIAKFLNATTADGYNPYRVTRAGIEWEIPEPDNPWSNIGYWSDHQIIYLQKLLEIAEQVHPGSLARLWGQPIFATADVPYRLRPYAEMLADWSHTIDFDWEREQAIEAAVDQIGSDGRLHRDPFGQVRHATMIEKILVLLLAKMANFVPEGGIWMNTQRPEWNDANNALVGKGLSVVTTAYLRRFVAFWREQLAGAASGQIEVNAALAELLAAVHAVFRRFEPSLATGFGDRERRAMMDALGQAITAYRGAIYRDGLPAATAPLDLPAVRAFLALAQRYIEQTLRANRRPDGLYHAYNILHLEAEAAGVEHLYLMLEGQVAILSSGQLTPAEALDLLQRLPQSELYRADQHTYMLYPNRRLPGFLEKNQIDAAAVAESALTAALTAAGDGRLLVRDEGGAYHFNGRFRNARDAAAALDVLAREPAYADLVAAERNFILDLFEATFNHKTFTGRSGTFFAYEGLGSVYWHMVAKLLLAAQECYRQAAAEQAGEEIIAALAAAYYDIRAGLGFNKTPVEYGAFPTDPYSHTPMGGGARQPGMTGQVKEEILTRWGELGVAVHAGQLEFSPTLLRPDEFLTAPEPFRYRDVAGREQTLTVPAQSLAFTCCQVPVLVTRGERDQIDVVGADGAVSTHPGGRLDPTTTRHILGRTGQVRLLRVFVRLAGSA